MCASVTHAFRTTKPVSETSCSIDDDDASSERRAASSESAIISETPVRSGDVDRDETRLETRETRANESSDSSSETSTEPPLANLAARVSSRSNPNASSPPPAAAMSSSAASSAARPLCAQAGEKKPSSGRSRHPTKSSRASGRTSGSDSRLVSFSRASATATHLAEKTRRACVSNAASKGDRQLSSSDASSWRVSSATASVRAFDDDEQCRSSVCVGDSSRTDRFVIVLSKGRISSRLASPKSSRGHSVGAMAASASRGVRRTYASTPPTTSRALRNRSRFSATITGAVSSSSSARSTRRARCASSANATSSTRDTARGNCASGVMGAYHRSVTNSRTTRSRRRAHDPRSPGSEGEGGDA
mmetsp:Transcript_13216/g.55502  ORF Transcript_13216/g.55502 Transcript_13216/m.55502 type:complete len:361 (+) Transcript_13216:578-1660(+)